MEILKIKNDVITERVIQSCLDVNVREFIICAGSRNSSFVDALRLEDILIENEQEKLKVYYWPEERSAAFFALGRARSTKRPVAIITTSGTAVAELFPATMEAYYSCDPLILITADRPRHYRGSGAPQSAEQEKIFGFYTKIALDISGEDPCDLSLWNGISPVHINVCLEEPDKEQKNERTKLKALNNLKTEILPFNAISESNVKEALDRFFETVQRPIAIVSAICEEDKENVAKFLIALGIPVMLEGISNLREDARLQSLMIKRTDKILESAEENGYSIDGILRIGGIPTHRIWRDLESCQDKINVFALSRLPFSGLSWSRQVMQCNLSKVLQGLIPRKSFYSENYAKWLSSQEVHNERLYDLFKSEPLAEPSLIHSISKLIPQNSLIYLGNSLPIREWDLSADRQSKSWMMKASRGVNGIDGQISTFLGMCEQNVDNFGIFGDLTTLYDMVGCWVLPKIEAKSVNIVVINNGGGKIFDRMYPFKEMQNLHKLNFRPLAEMWGIDYALWNEIPSELSCIDKRLIEIVPDDAATSRFWKAYEQIGSEVGAF